MAPEDRERALQARYLKTAVTTQSLARDSTKVSADAARLAQLFASREFESSLAGLRASSAASVPIQAVALDCINDEAMHHFGVPVSNALYRVFRKMWRQLEDEFGLGLYARGLHSLSKVTTITRQNRIGGPLRRHRGSKKARPSSAPSSGLTASSSGVPALFKTRNKMAMPVIQCQTDRQEHLWQEQQARELSQRQFDDMEQHAHEISQRQCDEMVQQARESAQRQFDEQVQQAREIAQREFAQQVQQAWEIAQRQFDEQIQQALGDCVAGPERRSLTSIQFQ